MRLKLGIIAAVVLTVSLAVGAQTPPGPMNPPPGQGMGPQGPGWGQGMGPQMQGRMGPGAGMGMGQGMGPGMRGRMGMGMGMRGRMGMNRPRIGLGMLARNPQFRERIGLTPEQVTRIETQESTFAKARVRNQADLQVKRMELQELLRAEKPDRALIDKKLREVGDAQLAMEKSGIDHRLTMQDILTAEQKQKMQELGQEMRTRMMQNRRGMGMGQGMGMGRGPMGPRPAQPPQPPKPPENPPGL